MANLLLFNKPFRVMCQFTDDRNRATLSHYISVPDVYPAGRLDFESEGLLLLTDDGNLQHRIASPSRKMPKTYLVQVEGEVSEHALSMLEQGIELREGMTRPARARQIPEPAVWPRIPPVRERLNVPTSWIELTLTEGRNRQVRRMTAAAGYPTLRLIRWRIGDWSLEGIAPGEHRRCTVNLPEDTRPEKNRPRRHRSNANPKRR